MPHNHFKGNEHPLHIPRDGPWFLDDLHLTNKATIGSVDLNEVCFANTCFLNQWAVVRFSDSPFRGINEGMIWSKTEI